MNKIAIHPRKGSFSDCWIEFCKENEIPWKPVNCYSSNIVDELHDCDKVMWHYHHSDCRDLLFARQLMFSLETAGKKVFPDFRTAWHFDDKVGQKYLLEAVDAPLVPSYVFYDKKEALAWAAETNFPKVFKLRRGAGSSHVKLVNTRLEAEKLIVKSFGKGFSQYQAGSNLKERWRKFKKGENSLFNLLKGVVRFGYTTEFDRVAGNERGYAYFQDFVPDNEFDIRVVVVNGKAFAIKRLVRENDFRASGSGMIEYGRENFDDETIRAAFRIAHTLQSQCIALDFVFLNGAPMIVEVSFGYTKEGYHACEGYWDESLKWHEGSFNPQYWMVESLLDEVKL